MAFDARKSMGRKQRALFRNAARRGSMGRKQRASFRNAARRGSPSAVKAHTPGLRACCRYALVPPRKAGK